MGSNISRVGIQPTDSQEAKKYSQMLNAIAATMIVNTILPRLSSFLLQTR